MASPLHPNYIILQVLIEPNTHILFKSLLLLLDTQNSWLITQPNKRQNNHTENNSFDNIIWCSSNYVLSILWLWLSNISYILGLGKYIHYTIIIITSAGLLYMANQIMYGLSSSCVTFFLFLFFFFIVLLPRVLMALSMLVIFVYILLL